MYMRLNKRHISSSDQSIHSLSWMRKTVEGSVAPSSDEGWLATGNAEGIIGITYTSVHKQGPNSDRKNFNLRGHKNICKVQLVRWNETHQKLASCDANGIVFVWSLHNGHWSIELINDRNCLVADFNWSHDGSMALICYEDGFVLSGTASGHKNWSQILNIENTKLTCGIWNGVDTKILLSTDHGEIIHMSVSGVELSRFTVEKHLEITSIIWSMFSSQQSYTKRGPFEAEGHEAEGHLTVASRTGKIFMGVTCYGPPEKVFRTRLNGIKMQWSSDGQFLAMCGFVRLGDLSCDSVVMIFNKNGVCRCSMPIPNQTRAVTDLVWGHDDQRLFISAGYQVYPLIVTKEIPLLKNLSQMAVFGYVTGPQDVKKLPLPQKIQSDVKQHFENTIKGYLPKPDKLHEYVCLPPPGKERIFCTMKQQSHDSTFILYIEHLGGLLPLLYGKRISKLRPDFVIFDPRCTNWKNCECASSAEKICASKDVSSLPSESKKTKRDKPAKNKEVECSKVCQRLVEVTSNFWGTRFRILGAAKFLPEDLGHIIYKTSLLHLQPRQMSIVVTDMADVFGVSLKNDHDKNEADTHNCLIDFNDFVIGENCRMHESDAHCASRSFSNKIDSSCLKVPVTNNKEDTEISSIKDGGLKVKMSTRKNGAIPKVRTTSTKDAKKKRIQNDQKIEQGKVELSLRKIKETPVLTDRVSCMFENMQGTQILEDRQIACWASRANAHMLGFLTNSNLARNIRIIDGECAFVAIENLLDNEPEIPVNTNERSSNSLEIQSREQVTRNRLSSGNDNNQNTCRDTCSSLVMSSNASQRCNELKNAHGSMSLDNMKSTHTSIKKCNSSDSGIEASLYDENAHCKSIGYHSTCVMCESNDIDEWDVNETSLGDKIPPKCHKVANSLPIEEPKQHVLYNKTPVWNEENQVYQLDFSGRVTQESAKNFQIECRGEQVMQFGRTDNNRYTLEFQYPFTPIQAFAVALANITQRLK